MVQLHKCSQVNIFLTTSIFVFECNAVAQSRDNEWWSDPLLLKYRERKGMTDRKYQERQAWSLSTEGYVPDSIRVPILVSYLSYKEGGIFMRILRRSRRRIIPSSSLQSSCFCLIITVCSWGRLKGWCSVFTELYTMCTRYGFNQFFIVQFSFLSSSAIPVFGS